jgi:hypothetical protein
MDFLFLKLMGGGGSQTQNGCDFISMVQHTPYTVETLKSFLWDQGIQTYYTGEISEEQA